MKSKLLFGYYMLLGYFARKYLRKHKAYIIGINGSVGKTSCRMIIYQTLKQFFPEVKISTSRKNFNGELGLSLSIFEQEDREPKLGTFFAMLIKAIRKTFRGPKPYDIIILEYGIDRPKEMEFLLSIAKPHIGVFTAIDAVHSEQFGNPAEIAKEEAKMIRNTLELGLLNTDDTYAMQLAEQISIDHLSYQTAGHESDADIHFGEEQFIFEEGVVEAGFTLWIKDREHKVRTNIIGKPNYGYIGVALTIAEVIGYQERFSPTKLQLPTHLRLEYQLQPGRLTIFEGVEQSVIIDSTYNASPLSLRKVIDAVHNMKMQLFPERKVRMLLGDMRELGELAEREHRMVAGYVSQVADRVFLVGKQMNEHLADELLKLGYDEHHIHSFMDSRHAGDAIHQMLSQTEEKYIVLCKGSQNTIFLEEAVKKLLANPNDELKLTRQGARWAKKKAEYFN